MWPLEALYVALRGRGLSFFCMSHNGCGFHQAKLSGRKPKFECRCYVVSTRIGLANSDVSLPNEKKFLQMNRARVCIVTPSPPDSGFAGANCCRLESPRKVMFECCQHCTNRPDAADGSRCTESTKAGLWCDKIPNRFHVQFCSCSV